MKRDKKWLKNQIEIMGTETSENYPHEQMVDREVVLRLVDQLDEPDKVVIPQFVADHIRFSKEDENSPRVSMDEAHISKELNDWLAKTEDYMHYPNQEKFMQAWVDGYEVEKEPLYYIKFSENQYAQKFDGTKIDSILVNDKSIAAKFTKEEIKKMNANFMALAVEVTE